MLTPIPDVIDGSVTCFWEIFEEVEGKEESLIMSETFFSKRSIKRRDLALASAKLYCCRRSAALSSESLPSGIKALFFFLTN